MTWGMRLRIVDFRLRIRANPKSAFPNPQS
jgi:hypothetical protein